MIKVLAFIILVSCSHLSHERSMTSGSQKKNGVAFFNYTDDSGALSLRREVKRQNKKIIVRSKLFLSGTQSEVEDLISVSHVGKLKGEVAVLPEISQFKIWYDKKEHFSQIKLDRKTKSLYIIAKAPVEKWNFQKNIKLPQGRYFCFFSQLPECLKEQKLLEKVVDKKLILYIIWDTYPFHNEIYRGLSEEPFAQASLSIAGHDKNTLKFSIDIENQSFFIHYDKDLNFTAYYWISQGISAVPISKE